MKKRLDYSSFFVAPLFSSFDTIVYTNDISIEKMKLIISIASKHPVNSNLLYVSFDNGLEGYWSFHKSRKGFYIELNVGNDEFFIPFGQIFVQSDKLLVKTTIYSSYLRFAFMYKFDFKKYINKFDLFNVGLNNIARVDRANDVPCTTVSSVYSQITCQNLINTQNKPEQHISKGGNLQTVYIGSRTSNYAFVRIYDKHLDTVRKGKSNLYTDYPDQVVRIEGQFGPSFCKGLTLDQLQAKILTRFCVDKNWKHNFYVGKRYDNTIIYDIEAYKKRAFNIFIKLFDNGYDVEHLINHALSVTGKDYRITVRRRKHKRPKP